MADMTVPSIRHSKRLVEAVEEKVGTQIEPKILVNRMDRRNNVAGLNVGDIEKALGNYYAGGLPNNYHLVRDAFDRGMQLNVLEPNNNITSELRNIILQDDASQTVEVSKRSGLLNFGRSLLKKKAS